MDGNDANPSQGGALSIQVSTAITKMVRHHDQDEREQDGSYHWDTVRSVLLKAFGKYPLTSPTMSIPTSSSLWFPSHWPTTSTPQTGLFLWPFCRTVSAQRFSTEVIFQRQNHLECSRQRNSKRTFAQVSPLEISKHATLSTWQQVHWAPYSQDA